MSHKSTEAREYVSLMDGEEHELLKERMKVMEMKAGQESGVELKGQERGGLCDVFFFVKRLHKMFLSFASVWDVERAGKKPEVW